MRAREGLSVGKEAGRVLIHGASDYICPGAACREKPVYRARNPGDSPLAQIVLNNLAEFEQG